MPEKDEATAFWADTENTRKLIRALGERLGVGRRAAEYYADEIRRWPADLAGALIDWLAGRPVECAAVVEGFDLKQLAADYGMTVPNALSTLNWLREKPEEARAALSPMVVDTARPMRGGSRA